MNYRGKQHKQRVASHESVRGWIFFLLYLVVFPPLMGLVHRSIGEEFPVAEANVVYYLLCVTLIFLVFWGYLKDSFSHFLDHLPESFFALITGFVGMMLLQGAIFFVPFPVDNPNTYSYPVQYILSPQATIAVLVILIPIVEEILFRGLLFGALRSRSRWLAWVVSVVFYCVYCVWQFAFSYGTVDLRYLLLALQMLPAALAFHWCYEKSGSVVASILLHMLANAFFLYIIVTRYTIG